jgi:hypothetical protein
MHTDDKESRRPMDDGEAFLPDPRDGGPTRVRDDLAEMMAEEFLSSASSGEEQTQEGRDQVVAEELGGPFIQSTDEEEMADDVDGNNPIDAEPEPFPRAIGGR